MEGKLGSQEPGSVRDVHQVLFLLASLCAWSVCILSTRSLYNPKRLFQAELLELNCTGRALQISRLLFSALCAKVPTRNLALWDFDRLFWSLYAPLTTGNTPA